MDRLKYIFSILALFLFAACNNGSPSDEVDTSNATILTQEEIDELDRGDKDSTTNITFTKGELKGMRLFMQNCNRCHPGWEKGKGPSLVDKKLPDFVIHFQVRNGLGDMPAFKKDELPKEDVKRIISFIKLLRKNLPAE